jgi:dCMP deaminase
MAISYIVSFRSFDDGSKVGCSFVKEVEFGGFKQYILYSTGYNGFPNTLSRFHDKLKKDEYMVHAETNAILSIIKNNAKIHKHTIVYSNLYSCDECLKSLFNVGVKKIIYFEDRYKVRSNIKDVKNSFLSNEEYFENISLFDENIRIQKTLNCEKCEDLKDKCEKCIIKPFINSFISLCKFNYFFNKNTDDLKQAKDYIVEYYSNYNLLNFLKINKDEQHQTIFNGDLRLDDIEEIFKNIVKLINDYIKKSNKVENKNYEENYDEVFYKNYIKNCNKVANKNCEEKYLANYDEVFYKDCQNIIDIYSKKEEKKE